LVFSAVEKPAYCRIVHGFCANIVAYGPPRNGGMPGRPPWCAVCASAAV
jgi:hypothetical protein